MKDISSLSAFNPPEYGDTVRFADGALAVVSQDTGDGWYLAVAGRRLCRSGFDMQVFIRAVLAEDRRRQEAA